MPHEIKLRQNSRIACLSVGSFGLCGVEGFQESIRQLLYHTRGGVDSLNLRKLLMDRNYILERPSYYTHLLEYGSPDTVDITAATPIVFSRPYLTLLSVRTMKSRINLSCGCYALLVLLDGRTVFVRMSCHTQLSSQWRWWTVSKEVQ